MTAFHSLVATIQLFIQSFGHVVQHLITEFQEHYWMTFCPLYIK